MDDDDNSAIVTNDTYHSIPIKYRSIFNPLQDQIIASVMLIVGKSLPFPVFVLLFKKKNSKSFQFIQTKRISVRVFNP